MSGNLTLSQVQENRILMPSLALRVDMELSNSYEAFVDCVNSALDSIIKFMEEDPGVRAKDSEDRLTIEIVGALRQAGYDANHDTKVGGHVDICVRHRCGYLWLGEAKIHKDYDWLIKGFNQLCTRYASGTPDHNSGGLVFYVRGKNTAEVVKNWKEIIEKVGLNNFSISQCKSRQQLAFYTTHTHDSSGLPYTIRHVAVSLHFSPKDK